MDDQRKAYRMTEEGHYAISMVLAVSISFVLLMVGIALGSVGSVTLSCTALFFQLAVAILLSDERGWRRSAQNYAMWWLVLNLVLPFPTTLLWLGVHVVKSSFEEVD